MDENTSTSGGGLIEKFTFLGESPYAWAVFLALVVVWLIIWGHIIKYLGVEE